ncbi:FAD-binding domain-containing protein, partial [Crucibulum laeve]
SPEYIAGISHYANLSSTQISKCVVEPGNAQDVSRVLKFVGTARIPFAVKGGGHATNPKFSSTTGVHIAMSRFSEITYNNSSKTVKVGAGLVWDDVYAALEPHDVKVAGGRVTGIGVAGFTLGGGYSWLGNQHGLAIDAVLEFELVTPNGTVLTVSQSSNPDLFFGLKGGQNNFGIVTSFTLQTFPGAQVWGGSRIFDGSQTQLLAAATIAFTTNVTDPKAAIITDYMTRFGQPLASVLVFYDGKTPPPGIFDSFLAIPAVISDVKTRSFLSLIQSSGDLPHNQRAIYGAISPLKFTQALSDVILNETLFWSAQLSSKSAMTIAYAIEPFLPSVYSQNITPTAYPPNRSLGFLPFNLYYSWNESAFDDDFHSAARQSSARIRDAAITEGQADVARAPLYPNYAIFDTPLEDIYGENLPKLRAL